MIELVCALALMGSGALLCGVVMGAVALHGKEAEE